MTLGRVFGGQGGGPGIPKMGHRSHPKGFWSHFWGSKAGNGETHFVRNCVDFGRPVQGQNVAKI